VTHLFLLLALAIQSPPEEGAAKSAPAPAQAATPVAKTKPAARPAKASKRRKKPPSLVLYHLNRHDTLVLRPNAGYDFPKGTQKRFNSFMRCHHTGRRHAMSPRLLRLLAQVSRHYDGRKLLIISGYRHPRVARNPRSPHKKGLAADFRVDGIANAELRDYCRFTFKKVGVGFYPNSLFVHLDVRKDHSAFWIDYSGPGETPVYSPNPLEDLRTGRVSTYKPGKMGESQGDDTEAAGPPPLGAPQVPVSGAPVNPPGLPAAAIPGTR
jgi:uncharacterized protein YcbK (DUF882 family)